MRQTPGGIVLPPGMTNAPIVGQQEQWSITPVLRWTKDRQHLLQMVVNPRTQEQRWVPVQEDRAGEFEAVPAGTPAPNLGTLEAGREAAEAPAVAS